MVNLPFLLCFTLYLRAIFQVQAPGGLIFGGAIQRSVFALPILGAYIWRGFSLRSCPLPISPLCLSREEGMIHLFVGSHVKMPESGLFPDWIGNNTNDLRRFDWPKCRHPLVVVN